MGVDQLTTQATVNPETVAELPMNNATLEVSDGTDDYTDGDVVAVATPSLTRRRLSRANPDAPVAFESPQADTSLP